ncbi:hypothetical protein ACIBEA_42290 [Streptomyces sp. NPDC051555]|uniref:hypothetical protein n=1 Tax=Streptomyces sp. NPDC051555 TaxID=3365657 RepID=UPI0037B6A0CF
MNRSEQDGPTAAQVPPNGNRRLFRLGATAVLLLATTALACGSPDSDTSSPSPAASSPAGNWPGNGDPATEAFRQHLKGNDSTTGLLAISMHVITEETGPPLSIRIITNLDPELRDSDAPDVAKAEKIARAFADWHTSKFKDHGTVKVSNPATETMSTATW